MQKKSHCKFKLRQGRLAELFSTVIFYCPSVSQDTLQSSYQANYTTASLFIWPHIPQTTEGPNTVLCWLKLDTKKLPNKFLPTTNSGLFYHNMLNKILFPSGDWMTWNNQACACICYHRQSYLWYALTKQSWRSCILLGLTFLRRQFAVKTSFGM